jgi:phospholipid/cholesterol/gamma-HCH transport system permease protein
MIVHSPSQNFFSTTGACARLFVSALSFGTVKRLRPNSLRYFWTEMGPNSLALVTLSAVFVSLALTTQVVLQLQEFHAEDMAGALIVTGLLRELGPLTVGMAWCARASAFMAGEVNTYLSQGERELLASAVLLPGWIAALISAVALSAYGLVIGLASATLYAPLLGVSSAGDFLESARLAVTDKDVTVYFIKLALVNPTIGVFVGTTIGAVSNKPAPAVPGQAVAFACVAILIANYLVTVAAYLP